MKTLSLHSVFSAFRIFLIVILPSATLSAQLPHPTDTLHAKRFKLVTIGAATFYTGTMTGLYALWYRDYPQSSLHTINDNNEWLGMDKAGHLTTSYYMGRCGYQALHWSGVSEKRAIWYGGTSGLFFLTTVELFDGFSKEWGFSWGDMAANTIGSALFISQQLLWHNQPITLKFSTHTTPLAKYRPNILGENLPQRVLKDYNGQTYWLSLNLTSLTGRQPYWPTWLNIALGYGADGMLGGRANPISSNGQLYPNKKRYHQFYLSFDIDLTRIPTKSKTLHTLLSALGFIKIPLPTLEYSNQQFTLHPFYF